MVMAFDAARRVLRRQVLHDMPRASRTRTATLASLDRLCGWDVQFRAHRLLQARDEQASREARRNGDASRATALWEYASDHRRALAELLQRLDPVDRAMKRLTLASDIHDLL